MSNQISSLASRICGFLPKASSEAEQRGIKRAVTDVVKKAASKANPLPPLPPLPPPLPMQKSVEKDTDVVKKAASKANPLPPLPPLPPPLPMQKSVEKDTNVVKKAASKANPLPPASSASSTLFFVESDEICSPEASQGLQTMAEVILITEIPISFEVDYLKKIIQKIKSANTIKEVLETLPIEVLNGERLNRLFLNGYKDDVLFLQKTYLEKLTTKLKELKESGSVTDKLAPDYFIGINEAVKDAVDEQERKTFNQAYLTKLTAEINGSASVTAKLKPLRFTQINKEVEGVVDEQERKTFNQAYLTKLTAEIEKSNSVTNTLSPYAFIEINETFKDKPEYQEQLQTLNQAYLTALTAKILTACNVENVLFKEALGKINKLFTNKPEYQEQLENLNHFYELAQSGILVKLLTQDLKPISTKIIDKILIPDTIENLKKIDFEKITITKTNAFAGLKSKINNILEKYKDSIGAETQKTIQLFLANDIYSIMFKNLPEEIEKTEAVKEIRKAISTYLEFNKVEDKESTYTIGDVQISGLNEAGKETLQYIFNAIPQLVVLLGKSQAGDRFDIGKHILAVGQEVVKNGAFEGLKDKDKKLVLIAALMHDIAKVEGGQDPTHPQRGANYAYHLLKNTLGEKDATTVANLIFNHHFGEYIAKAETDDVMTLAYEFNDKNPEFITMLKILGEADLLGDNKSYQFKMKEFREAISNLEGKAAENVKEILKSLKDILKLTPFPQRTIDITDDSSIMKEMKEKEIVGEFTKEGVTVKKIDLAAMKAVSPEQQRKYLEALGFGEVDYNQLKLLIHAITSNEDVYGIDYLTSQFKSDAALSTSIMTMVDTAICGTFGFIMEPDETNIVYACPAIFCSGNKKTRNQSGKYINATKNETKMYALLTELKDYFQQPKNGIRKVSELITIDNKVAAIFVEDEAKKIIPKELLQFAANRGLPLVVVPTQ